ncbi:MAG: phosphate acyltransferase PlsX [Candidatus Gastranaerophilaceae bacterium]|jgi:glycerol-3-phosphate acyltransferase PlsX
MTVKIALDAMGGDYAPTEVVKGAVIAAREYKISLLLVGKEDLIRDELSKYNTKDLDIDIKHTDEVIEMNESPGKALRTKKNASIVLAVQAVANGEAQAVVAAGSTGAAMAASLLGLGRLPGIDRPAISCVLPSTKKPVVLIDAGANSDCDPKMLYQFAIMGRIFAKSVLGYENPTVGIMNIGEEEGKGNELVKEAYNLMKSHKESLNFIGNIEGRDIVKGDCQVIVCDGFVGNVILKAVEGVGAMLFKLIKEQFNASIFTKILGLMVKPLFKNIMTKVNYEEYGGALLLGVKGVTVISHGSSKAYAIKNAIRVAKEAVENDINGKIIATYEKNSL